MKPSLLRRLAWVLSLSVVPGFAQSITNSPVQLEPNVPHADLIRSWNRESYVRGEKLYQTICQACHGTPQQPGSLPTSRAFWREQFKNGSDPVSIYKTLTAGLGQMPSWPFLRPDQKYDVIHYVREALIKPNNPAAYFEVTSNYLAALPVPTGQFQKTAEMLEFEKGSKYLRMDFGPTLFWTLEVASNNIAYKGIAVRLDVGPGGISKGHAWMLYDHDTMRVAATWTGDKFVDWKGIAFDGTHQTHTSIVGDKAFINPPGPGWASPETGGFDDPRLHGRDGKPYGPLPRGWTHYRGLYLATNKVLIAYTVGDAEVIETPGLERNGALGGFSRNLSIGKSSRDLLLRLCPLNAPVALVGQSAARLEEDLTSRLIRIPARATPLNLKVLIGHEAPKRNDSSLSILAVSASPATDLHEFMNGGATRWPTEIITEGKLGADDAAYAVDTITSPPDNLNPYQSWMRFGGFDFFKDGKSAAICTWNGDVWKVSGIEGELRAVKWKRIASGLFQPLGVKIVDETIYVCCRDQMARLHDLNGDGEIDFYENFNNDNQVTEHFHEFAMGLQTDREGNFYYAKSARHALPALVPHHGTLLKVSKDGSHTEIVATGFRAANGVCVNDDGTFFVTDQEGHWTPKNRINWVRRGRFYGNMFAYNHPESGDDSQMEQSVVWITNDIDRSPGEIVRVTSNQWGPLSGMLLNLSYGMGRIFVVPCEKVSGELQGGVVQLPVPDFPTGIMRGRFHPQNGQLYACGLVGWSSNQHDDGGFYRVRYTGKPAYLPIELHALTGAFEIKFTDPLNPVTLGAEDFTVRAWSLKRTADYGSPHINEHSLPVSRASLSKDAKTVRLDIPEIQPTWCMEIRCRLRGQDGTPFVRTINNTVHTLADGPVAHRHQQRDN